MKKNSCTPINPKKYSCYGLKKIPAAQKFPTPPITFLTVRPLEVMGAGKNGAREGDTYPTRSLAMNKFNIFCPVLVY